MSPEIGYTFAKTQLNLQIASPFGQGKFIRIQFSPEEKDYKPKLSLF